MHISVRSCTRVCSPKYIIDHLDVKIQVSINYPIIMPRTKHKSLEEYCALVNWLGEFQVIILSKNAQWKLNKNMKKKHPGKQRTYTRVCVQSLKAWYINLESHMMHNLPSQLLTEGFSICVKMIPNFIGLIHHLTCIYWEDIMKHIRLTVLSISCDHCWSKLEFLVIFWYI